MVPEYVLYPGRIGIWRCRFCGGGELENQENNKYLNKYLILVTLILAWCDDQMRGSNSNLCWFLRRGENRGAWRKTLGARTRTNIKLNPHVTTGLGIEPGWWWEASALPTGAIPASPKKPLEQGRKPTPD